MKKTENLRVRLPEDIEVRLWRTDQLLKNGRKDTAVSALAEMRDAVLKCRDIKPQLYCYYQYLELLNEPSEEKMQDWPVIYENCFLRPEGQMDSCFICW